MEIHDIGPVSVERIVEWSGVLFTREGVLDSSPREVWDANRTWLEPDFWNSETDEIIVAIQTFVLRSNGKIILIDTGIGNDKPRPDIPPFDQLQTDFLDKLHTAGINPDDVNIVICTHLHPDHCGWNTKLVDGQWVPTFPRAKYLISQAELDFWDPANGHAQDGPHAEDHVRVWIDSVAPVLSQVVAWTDNYVIDNHITLEQVSGHTPGSAVVNVQAGESRVVFVGDLVGSPMMICHPDLFARNNGRTIDHDSHELESARRRILGAAADAGTVIVPAHFDCARGVTITRRGDGFTIALVEES